MSQIIFDTETETYEVPYDGSGDDSLIHITCCNDDVAFCGTDVSNTPILDWTDYPNPRDCVVCKDIDDSTGCPECGG